VTRVRLKEVWRKQYRHDVFGTSGEIWGGCIIDLWPTIHWSDKAQVINSKYFILKHSILFFLAVINMFRKLNHVILLALFLVSILHMDLAAICHAVQIVIFCSHGTE